MNGSSPLTRGKRPDSPVVAARGRLIPAHAGKTWSPRRCLGPTGAHPRSRGENFDRTNCISVSLGSSPLTRGKLDNLTIGEVITRLIPAHAGKT